MQEDVETISALSWTYTDPVGEEDEGAEFLRLACLSWTERDSPDRRRRAEDLLRRRPDLPVRSLAVAAVCGDVDAVRDHLSRDPAAAVGTAAPFGWSPLMHLAHARVEVRLEACLAVATALLDAGADPDDGRYSLGLLPPFTVLTGVFGGGETDQPPHPHAGPLARLLLERGADPNDGQTLYNRMFGLDDDFLALLMAFGLGRGDGGPWRRRLPDLTPDPAAQLRPLLEWAVLHDQRARVRLLAEHGVDLALPLPGGLTAVATALCCGHGELAADLRRLGAPAPDLDPVEQFVAAAFAGDGDAVRRTPADVVAAARQARPALVVWAAACGAVEAVELLVQAGFDVDALGRMDLPREQPWETALHTAVERDDALLLSRLLDLGADRTIRDHRFDGTPLDWAEHLGRPRLARLLAPGGA